MLLVLYLATRENYKCFNKSQALWCILQYKSRTGRTRKKILTVLDLVFEMTFFDAWPHPTTNQNLSKDVLTKSIKKMNSQKFKNVTKIKISRNGCIYRITWIGKTSKNNRLLKFNIELILIYEELACPWNWLPNHYKQCIIASQTHTCTYNVHNHIDSNLERDIKSLLCYNCC